MTKNEIIAEIQAKPYYFQTIINTEQTILANGTKVFQIEILEVCDKSASQKAIAYYVVNDGLPEEAAYYKDVESTPNVITFAEKIKPLQKEYNASIVESGDTWALTETNILVNNAGVWSIVKDRYFLVDGNPISITKIG